MLFSQQRQTRGHRIAIRLCGCACCQFERTLCFARRVFMEIEAVSNLTLLRYNVRCLQQIRQICSHCQPTVSAYDQSQNFIRGLPVKCSKHLLLMDMHQFTAIAERNLELHQAAWQAREFASGSRPATPNSYILMPHVQKNVNFRKARTLFRHQQRTQRWAQRSVVWSSFPEDCRQ